MIDTGHHRLSIGTISGASANDRSLDRLHLTIDEFNSVSTAGVATSNRLEEMLDNAAFAFLILTAEDEQADRTLRARENVVHETGLFQGNSALKRRSSFWRKRAKNSPTPTV